MKKTTANFILTVTLFACLAALVMADGFQPSGGSSSGSVRTNQVVFTTVTDTNVLVAYGQFTNYATRFYWNPNYAYSDAGGSFVGAYTNGSSRTIAQGGAGLEHVFVAMGSDGTWVSTEGGIGNAIYNNLSDGGPTITNGWPGVQVDGYTSGGFMFLATNGVVGVTSNQFIGTLNLGQIAGGSNITTNNASTITSGTLGAAFLPATVVTNNNSGAQTQVISGTNTINGKLTVTNSLVVSGGTISGNGSGITNATASYPTNIVNGATNVNNLTRVVQWTIPVVATAPAATLGNAEIDAQLFLNSTWVTVDECGIAGGATSVISTNRQTFVVTVPPGGSFRLTNTVSGAGYVAGVDNPANKTNTFTVFP